MDHHEIAKADWIGLSMGAMTGMGLAIHRPEPLRPDGLADARAEATDAYKTMWDQRIAAVKAGGVEAVAEGSWGSGSPRTGASQPRGDGGGPRDDRQHRPRRLHRLLPCAEETRLPEGSVPALAAERRGPAA
jgi:pimeloyl-ACP methyl ester carboxylesterase